MIGGERFLGAGLGGFHAGFAGTGVEDGAGELRADGIGAGAFFEQVAQVATDEAALAGEREAGEAEGFGDSDLRCGGLETLVGGGDVRPACDQRRGQSAADGEGGTQAVEAAAAGDAAGVFAEQRADFIFLGGDGLLGGRDGDLRLGEQGLGLADFEIRADAAVPAGGDQLERTLAAFHRAAGNREALIEVFQVDVGAGDGGDEGGLDAVALGFGGQQVRAGGLVVATDAAPEIGFPAQEPGQAVGFAGIFQAVIRGGVGAAVKPWKPSGAGDFRLGAGGFDAVSGGDEVRVVGEGAGDQGAQRGVGENLAPRLVAEGNAMRRDVAADRGGQGGFRRPGFRTEDAGAHENHAGQDENRVHWNRDSWNVVWVPQCRASLSQATGEG